MNRKFYILIFVIFLSYYGFFQGKLFGGKNAKTGNFNTLLHILVITTISFLKSNFHNSIILREILFMFMKFRGQNYFNEVRR